MQFGLKFFHLWLQQTADPDLNLSLKIETNVNCILLNILQIANQNFVKAFHIICYFIYI